MNNNVNGEVATVRRPSKVVQFLEDSLDSEKDPSQITSTTNLNIITTVEDDNDKDSKSFLGIQIPVKLLTILPAQRQFLKWSTFLLYNAYLIYAIYYHLDTKPDCQASKEECWGWCNGLGFIIIITAIVYLFLSYLLIFKGYLLPLFPYNLRQNCKSKINSVNRLIERHLQVRLGLYALVTVCIVAFFIWDTWTDRQRLISAAGIAVIVLFGAVFSKFPLHINWRQVVWGVTLQLVFGLLILRWELGKSILDCVSKKVDRFLGFTDAGSGFVFGFLVTQQPFIPGKLLEHDLAYNVTSAINNSRAFQSVVVFRSLSVIYFFCFVTNILFYFGAVQWITAKLGWLLSKTIATTPCESMNAASNIFLGQAVAPLLIKPYIERLTMSEIHAVITSGFATIAGTVMAAFISFGVSPAHLLSASFMSAPAALACSKLLYPEREKSKLSEEEIRLETGCGGSTNLLDAATRGAVEGANLVLHITAIVVAFIASVAFLNTMVSFFGGLGSIFTTS